MTTRDVQLSKTLSWLLRHGATKEGIRVRPDGFVELDLVLQHRAFRHKYNKEDILRVVRNCNKQRYSIRVNPETNVLEIRANQGHTLTELRDSTLYLKPVIEPNKYKTIVHGTFRKCWPQIKEQGLSRMNRLHIHFAKTNTEDPSVLTGLRTNSELHIYVDLEKPLSDGIKFFESDNGVILTPGNENGFLLPKYFSRVVDVGTGMLIHFVLSVFVSHFIFVLQYYPLPYCI